MNDFNFISLVILIKLGGWKIIKLSRGGLDLEIWIWLDLTTWGEFWFGIDLNSVWIWLYQKIWIGFWICSNLW